MVVVLTHLYRAGQPPEVFPGYARLKLENNLHRTWNILAPLLFDVDTTCPNVAELMAELDPRKPVMLPGATKFGWLSTLNASRE